MLTGADKAGFLAEIIYEQPLFRVAEMGPVNLKF